MLLPIKNRNPRRFLLLSNKLANIQLFLFHRQCWKFYWKIFFGADFGTENRKIPIFPLRPTSTSKNLFCDKFIGFPEKQGDSLLFPNHQQLPRKRRPQVQLPHGHLHHPRQFQNPWTERDSWFCTACDAEGWQKSCFFRESVLPFDRFE